MSALPLSVPELQPGASAPDPAVPAGPRTSLSPSRASDFMTCPLLYRFRVLDRLPEAPSPAAVRGTVVHQVLEDLFGLPRAERTVERAVALVPTAWAALLEQAPDTIDMFDSPDEVAAWLQSATPLLHKYFELEDPTGFEPAERELRVETDAGSTASCCAGSSTASTSRRRPDPGRGLQDRPGAVTRVRGRRRCSRCGSTRSCCGGSTGVLPSLLQLIYLGSGEMVRYEPDEADLRATERKIGALWTAITRATDTGDWRPSPSRLCDWCDHRAICPAWGGTPPPLPVEPAPALLPSEEPEPLG